MSEKETRYCGGEIAMLFLSFQASVGRAGLDMRPSASAETRRQPRDPDRRPSSGHSPPGNRRRQGQFGNQRRLQTLLRHVHRQTVSRYVCYLFFLFFCQDF